MSEETETFLVRMPNGGAEPLTRNEIRKRIREGNLKDSDLIWNEKERDWKPAKTFPWLGKTTVLPTATVIDEIRNRSTIQAKAMTNIIQRDQATRKSTEGDQPEEKPRAFVENRKLSPKSQRLETEESSPSESETDAPSTNESEESSSPTTSISEEGSSRFKIPKWFYPLSLFAFVFFVFILNWLNIQHQVNSRLSNLGYDSSATPTVHYEYYLNPRVLIVNFSNISKSTSPEDFVDIITIIARLRPAAWTGNLFHAIHLQNEGKTTYVIKGSTWKVLDNYYDEVVLVRSSLLIKNLFLPNGEAVPFELSDNSSKEIAEEQRVFSAFCQSFLSVPVPKDFFIEPSSSASANGTTPQ
jgi:hypothetical protein